MNYSPGEFEEILGIFKAESEEIVQEINDNFLVLENNPDDKTPLKRLLQLVHSLKGAARMLGFRGIQNIAHKIEDILSFWNTNNIKITPVVFEPVYKACDYILEIMNKCVETKADYQTDTINEIITNLDAVLKLKYEKIDNLERVQNKPGIKEQKKLTKDESEKYIIDKQTDINAILLEVIFISEKNTEEDKNDVLTVIRDNITELKEIFMRTVYEDILLKLSVLYDETKNDDFDFNVFRTGIFDLRKDISALFHSGDERESRKEDNKQVISDEKSDKSIRIEIPASAGSSEENEQPGITWQFNEILNNLPKIREQQGYIKTVSAFLRELNTLSEDSFLSAIIVKTLKILDLFLEKSVPVDKDCYMVILQSIYLAKRIYMKEEGFEHVNIDFLMQRLSLVEDMLNLSSAKIGLPASNNEMSIISPEEYVNNNPEPSYSSELREIKTIRIESSKLDNLVTQTGELLVNGIKTRKHLYELNKIAAKTAEENAENKKILNYVKYLEKKGFFAQFSDDGFNMFLRKIQNFLVANGRIATEISNDITELYNVMSNDDNKLNQNAVEIDSIAKGIRVLPLATIFHSFPRMVRDIALEKNRKVDFVINGSDTTVDKKIIEEIKMPLIHILRNSVSHGIEPAAERIAKNKNETGKIILTARQAENHVYISVEDDGYGIDLNMVKEAAVSKGLLYKEEAELLNKEQIVKLLFLPGFSTDTAVSEISGRGVGLDIVKTKITNLNGDIIVDSEVDRGCKITIKLPLTLSTLKVFVILAGTQKYAIPVTSIKYVKTVTADDIYEKNGLKYILFESHSVRFISLSEVLFGEGKQYNKDENITVIITEEKGKEAAIAVDKLIRDAEVFGKKLINPIIKIKNISGFTTLEDGEICLIINVNDLLNRVINEEFLNSAKNLPLINNGE